jgi:hypothetical protein
MIYYFKIYLLCQAPVIPIILATEEVEIRRIAD